MKLSNHDTRVRAVLVVALVVALTQFPVTHAEDPDQGAAAGAGQSRIEGKITGSDGAPLAGVQVHAYHLATEQLFTSTATAANGSYNLEGLPHGYFDLAVETPDGVFVGNQVASLIPGGKAVLNFSLIAFTDPSEMGREFPGSTGSSKGVAQVQKKKAGREFWRSPKGVAVIAGAGGLVLLAVAGSGGGSDTPPVSPASP